MAIAYSRLLKQPEIRLARMDGYQIYVNVAENLGIAPYFFRDPGTVWLTADLVTSGSTCVDAGANIGHYTFFLASRVGPEGRVIAFEPSARHGELLARSIRVNRFERVVTVEPIALWERSGERLTFYLSNDPSNSGLNSLILQGDHLNQSRTTVVETTTLSEYAQSRSIDRFRLVKIDVERAEHHVLAGMVELLTARRIDYLIVEMFAHGEAQELLTRAGYACYLLDSGRRRLSPVAEVPQDRFGDYLAVSPRVFDEFHATRSRIES